MATMDGIKIPAVVGVIASVEELRTAARMRTPPDLFELRLDYLPNLQPENISRLRRPFIITARHSTEGGYSVREGNTGGRSSATTGSPAAAGQLRSPLHSRRNLLLKFLPHAQFVDVELRSLRELREVWKRAARLKIGRICSVHDFTRTPPHSVLQKQFQRAERAGADIFKLVTRADTRVDVVTLLQFLRPACAPGSRGRSPSHIGDRTRCCVMATGKFGPSSRRLFPHYGSVFIYAPLRRALYPGQLTLRQLRSYRGMKSPSSRAKPRDPVMLP
jgi:3-dehydroquinate dehydratase type I